MVEKWGRRKETGKSYRRVQEGGGGARGNGKGWVGEKISVDA